VSDEEVAFGITHNDHCGTEEWRKDAIHRIETGAVTTPTHEQEYVQRPSRTHAGRVAGVVAVVLLGLIALQTWLIGS